MSRLLVTKGLRAASRCAYPRTCLSTRLGRPTTATATATATTAMVHSPRYSTFPLKHGLPMNAWDSHMHIVGNPEKYPLAGHAAYKPEAIHDIEDACCFETLHGTPRMVLVGVSIHGNDNSCLLDGLRTLTPKYGRGVVTVDPHTTSLETLREWHALGVRGIRVNVKSVSDRLLPADEFQQLLAPYAALVRAMDWVLDLHIALPMVDALAALAPSLGVKLCLDHFGGPSLEGFDGNPYSLQGFQSLIDLLRQGSTWVKLSGPYRLSKAATVDEQAAQLAPLAHEILAEAPARALYASDWPHTRFEGRVDAARYRDIVVGWCNEFQHTVGLVDKVFGDNPDELWK